jgi:hypothetical protein
LIDERRAKLLALAILALLPTLFFADVLLGWNSLYTGDIQDYHVPAARVLREIVRAGEFPYWNPFYAAGQPLAANPAYRIFYPPVWLVLLPDVHLGVQYLIVAHVYLALFAMYALLRSLEIRRGVAVIGALSFGLGGIVLSTTTLFPFLFSLSWMPLTCLYGRRFLKGRGIRSALLASAFLGVQLLIGEPTIVIQTGLLLALYAIHRALSAPAPARAAMRGLALVALLSAGAVLLAAVQIVPALDHVRDSVRGRGLDYSIVASWSMAPARALELFFPNAFGHPRLDGPFLYWGSRLYPTEFRPFFASMYSGLLVAILLVAGLVSRVRGSRLMLAVAVVSFVLAIGRHTPLFRVLYELGLANWFRYPEKFAFMLVFAAIVFSARVLQEIAGGHDSARRTALVTTAIVCSLALLCFLVTSTPAYPRVFRALWHPAQVFPVDEMMAASRTDWLMVFLRAALLALLLRNFGRVRGSGWIALAAVFVCLDLAITVPDLTARVTSDFFRETPKAAAMLPQNHDEYRIFNGAYWSRRSREGAVYTRPDEFLFWTTRNSLLPEIPATYGLRMAIENDYDLTHLLPTTDFVRSMDELARARRDWTEIAASMSNIWFVGNYRDPREAVALSNGDPREIQPVRFVERDHSPRYYFATRIVTMRDRHDFVRDLTGAASARGVAYVTTPAFVPAAGIVRSWKETPNSAVLDVEAAGRAFLVMSVTSHKYWTIRIDGTAANAIVTNVGYQGVEVPRGRHVVTMTYRNPLIPVGGAITAATLLSFILIARRGSVFR